MNFLKSIILLSSFLIILNNCSSLSEAGKVLRNEKIRTTDEFLIKKKEPLTQPPDFQKIPEPGSIEDRAATDENSIEKIYIINPGTSYPIKIHAKDESKAKEIFKSAFPKIITVARLDKRKSHQNILMTVKNLIPIYPDIKYVCVGDGDERSNLENLRKQLNIEKQVTFLPRTAENLKVALLNESDLFLMPSIIYKKSVEGFGISFIEAGSYGKTSIGGKDGGQADAIKDGVTGYLCDGSNLSTIYETILKVFRNDQYKILGSQAKEFSKKFKWENIVKQYLNLI